MKKNIDQKSQLEKMKKDIEKTQNDIEKTKNGIEKTKNEKCQENIKVLQDFLAQQNLLLEDAGLKLK
jgi:predicted phage gp36 major capsid-like protein